MKKFGAAVLMGLVLTAGVVFTASKSDNDRSVDDVVRLNGQWVIMSRNVSPQD